MKSNDEEIFFIHTSAFLQITFVGGESLTLIGCPQLEQVTSDKELYEGKDRQHHKIVE